MSLKYTWMCSYTYNRSSASFQFQQSRDKLLLLLCEKSVLAEQKPKGYGNGWHVAEWISEASWWYDMALTITLQSSLCCLSKSEGIFFLSPKSQHKVAPCLWTPGVFLMSTGPSDTRWLALTWVGCAFFFFFVVVLFVLCVIICCWLQRSWRSGRSQSEPNASLFSVCTNCFHICLNGVNKRKQLQHKVFLFFCFVLLTWLILGINV